ncbi:MAG: hypothetical protein L5656_07090 [Thermanaeromonas sp.]|uniref:hypothetical protein n=1 Tax=Thermanaeromonas sp. TaxID=2003697 RepID=UPI00244050AA|nr:hypothetical protein [Thermanaeromonas sp.]MCG0278281.1 hypothetical protein [Thermanaeromonas sp.]
MLPAGKTLVWHLAGEAWALYTGDPGAAEAARKGGLRRMAEYYDLREEGKLIAWQFVGPKEKVLAIAGGTSYIPVDNIDRTGEPGQHEKQEEGGTTPEQLRLF